jgi:hypothetical protein
MIARILDALLDALPSTIGSRIPSRFLKRLDDHHRRICTDLFSSSRRQALSRGTIARNICILLVFWLGYACAIALLASLVGGLIVLLLKMFEV